VLFEMLTGRTPFEGHLAALSYAHTHTPAPRVRSIDPSVPVAIDELVAAMLAKDPADRPQTGDDVRRSLEAAMTQKDPGRPFAPAEELEATLQIASGGERGDTLPLPAVDAALTEPIARRASSAQSSARRRWWPVAIVAAVVLLGALLAFAAGPPGVPSLQPAHEARKEALAVAEQAVGEGSSAAEAYATLVWVVRVGDIVAEIGAPVADELATRAERILDAYTIGDIDGVAEQVEGFRGAVARAVEDEAMSPTAAAAVLERLVQLKAAISNELVEPSVEEEEPTTVQDEDPEDSGGSAGDKEKGGPPPHAEAHGHDN
jgi:hypothetical protein